MVLLTAPCLCLSAGVRHLPRDGAGGILQVTPDQPVKADGPNSGGIQLPSKWTETLHGMFIATEWVWTFSENKHNLGSPSFLFIYCWLKKKLEMGFSWQFKPYLSTSCIRSRSYIPFCVVINVSTS